MTEASIQQAVSDLAMIRRAIGRVEPDSPKAQTSALDANIMLQVLSLVFVFFLAMVELIGDQAITRALMVSPTFGSQDIILGLADVGLALLLMVVCAYFVVWRSARHGDQDFADFVARNFRYLRSLSFIGDLVVKFAVFSLVVVAPRPEWVGPLLALFTGDYLIQGRFFSLPLGASLVCGVACVLCAALLFLQSVSALIWPLTLFLGVNVISVGLILRARRTASRAQKVGAG